MALNPALRSMIDAASEKNTVARHGANLPVPHLVACLAELGLQKATKKELLRVMRMALAREAAE